MKVVFVAERPTQIITALALRDNLKLMGNVKIIVANCFYNAPTIVERFSEIEPLISFRLTSSYNEAIEIASAELPAHLFIHWDVGFGTHWRLRRLIQKNKGQKISVFEEGVGTYRQDIYPTFKRKIFRLLGLPINVGGSKYISEIYVYDRDEYIKNSLARPPHVRQIAPTLSDVLLKHEAQYSHVFSAMKLFEALEKSNRSTCAIYLSGWNFKASNLDKILPDHGAKVVKLHPHCQTNIQSVDVLVAPNSLPAELLIMVASRIFQSVIVHHHASSVEKYINVENVKFRNIESI